MHTATPRPAYAHTSVPTRVITITRNWTTEAGHLTRLTLDNACGMWRVVRAEPCTLITRYVETLEQARYVARRLAVA